MTKKRIPSVLLALCLFVPLLVSTAAYAGTMKPINTEAQLQTAFFDGGSYKLTNSIALSEGIELSDTAENGIFGNNDITIDLNGYSISSSTFVFKIGNYASGGNGDITILDSQGGGSVISTGLMTSAISFNSNSNNRYNSLLTIRGGSYSGSDCALSIPDGLNANIKIEAGIFTYTGKSGMPIRGAYTASGSPAYSEDGKTLTITANSPPDDKSTSQTASETTSAENLPTESVTQETQDAQQKQAAKVKVNTDIPRATYTVSIPSTISVPTLERVRTDAPEEEKVSNTPFVISIQNIEHFFHEKAVSVTLNSDFMMENTENPEDKLSYLIMQNNAAYQPGTVFALLDEIATETSGKIVIDKSAIKKSGNYQGNIEFIFNLEG